MPKHTIICITFICLCLAGQGCSKQAWYTGLQEQQRQQCYKNNMSPSEVQQCLERVNSTSYDQYKAQREQIIERDKQ